MIIPQAVLKAAAVASDTESARYALAGVYLTRDKDGPAAVSTDGRRMIVFRFPDVDTPDDAKRFDFGEVVPLSEVKELSRLAGRGGSVSLDERGSNGKMKFSAIPKPGSKTGQADKDVLPAEGRFPRWSDVLPEDRDPVKDEITGLSRKSVRVTLDARMLAELLSAMFDAAPSEEQRGVTLDIPLPNRDGEQGPVILRRSELFSGVESTAILMPIRVND